MAQIKCSICLDSSIESNDYFVSTMCGHIFHNSCVNSYLVINRSHRRCPNCRKPLTRDLIKLHGVNESSSKTEKTEGEEMKRRYTFKVIMVGAYSVGKTTLLKHYLDGRFSDVKGTVGIDHAMKTTTFGGNEIKLTLWDTSGQERFNATTHQYMRDADGVLITYDMSNYLTLVKANFEWVERVKQLIPNAAKILVGARSDIEVTDSSVTTDQIWDVANRHSLKHFETSAKKSENINIVFKALIGEMIENQAKSNNEEANNTVHLSKKNNEDVKSKNWCC